MVQRCVSTSAFHERRVVSKGSGEQRSQISSDTTAANTSVFAKWVSLHEACHDKIAAHLYRGSEPSSQPSRRTLPSQLPRVSTMEAKSQRPKGRESTISALDASIEVLNLAKEISSITPAKAVFGSVSVILTTIRVSSPMFFYWSNADRNAYIRTP